MKISAKTEYACRALLELGAHWPSAEPMQISAVAQKHGIPMKFLPHILLQLKQLGYVESVLGQRGGYLLARAPKEIRLSEIIAHFEVSKVLSKGQRGKKNDVLKNIFEEADQVLGKFLDAITLEDIIQRDRNSQKVPMYTI